MMKKLLILVLIVCLNFSYFDISSAQAYDQNSLTTYLNAHNTSAWSVMGLAALGESNINANHLKNIQASDAISLTAPILAITATGQNPHTFGGSDYVSSLKNYYNQNQLGDTNLLNDDIFGLLALVAAGENPQSEMISSLKNHIITNQNTDGGWGFMIGASSDTNMTAVALIALKASQSNANDSSQNAWQYLQNQQKNDGGFAYDASSQNADAASTAWVLWAMNAWQIPASQYQKDGHNPQEYLNTLQHSAGYFLYQTDAVLDNFTTTVSAYAAIALNNKTLPLHIFNNSQNITEYNFRIEGASETICSGKVAAITALDIIKNASKLCDFTYHISDTSYGPYLDQIANDQASGLNGWMYLINNQSANVGAADYQLQSTDTVLWYFGAYDWLATEIILSDATMPSGQATTATVRYFNANQWQVLSEANIYFGAQNTQTNAQGQAQLNMPDGYYRIYAEKNGYIRSNQVLATVGTPSGDNIGLNVNINGNGLTLPPANNLLSFLVEPGDIDFGNLTAGQSAQRSITITNQGSDNITVASTVNGDQIFVDNLQVDNKPWSIFAIEINAGANVNKTLKLTIPATYQANGQKNGTITFWSN